MRILKTLHAFNANVTAQVSCEEMSWNVQKQIHGKECQMYLHPMHPFPGADLSSGKAKFKAAVACTLSYGLLGPYRSFKKVCTLAWELIKRIVTAFMAPLKQANAGKRLRVFTKGLDNIRLCNTLKRIVRNTLRMIPIAGPFVARLFDMGAYLIGSGASKITNLVNTNRRKWAARRFYELSALAKQRLLTKSEIKKADQVTTILFPRISL